MKRLLSFLLVWVGFFSLSAQNVDDIFTFAPDGTIQDKPVYYNEEEFSWDESFGLKNFSTMTFHTKDKTPYTVKLRQYRGETSIHAFNTIDVLYKGTPIYSAKNEDLWTDAKSTSGNARQYEVISLTNTASAILFFGWPYGGDPPPLLTIVVVNQGKAKLVFNRHCCISDYKDKEGEFSIIYADQIQEYNPETDAFEPADDKLDKFKIWKSDGVLKFRQIQ